MPINHSHAAAVASVGLSALAFAGTPTPGLFVQRAK